MKSQPETSVRDFAQHLDPSLTLRVGVDGTYFGTVPKSQQLVTIDKLVGVQERETDIRQGSSAGIAICRLQIGNEVGV